MVPRDCYYLDDISYHILHYRFPIAVIVCVVYDPAGNLYNLAVQIEWIEPVMREVVPSESSMLRYIRSLSAFETVMMNLLDTYD